MEAILISVTTALYTTIIRTVIKIAGPFIAEQLLFEGKVRDEFRNKEVFKEITNRYKDSIDDFNRKIAFTIAFTVVASYVYFVLPVNETVKVPLIDLAVSRSIWISIAPVISYGLEVLVITSFLWFLVLRVGTKLLVAKQEDKKLESELIHQVENMLKQDSSIESANIIREAQKQNSGEVFADLTNILLKGTLGDLWMIFRIRKVFESRWHYLWYIPLFLLVVLIALSPGLISLFFTYQLFRVGYLGLGIIYAIIFIPVSVLLLILIGMVGLLSVTEYV